MNGPIAIAGAGRIACALGRLLRERGAEISAVASRRTDRAEAAARFIGGACVPVMYADLPGTARQLIIAVADDALPSVAGLLASDCREGTVVLHTSGRQGAEALSALAGRGASCGSIHPLQTVASAEQGVAALPGAAFAVDGDGEAKAWALEIAASLCGTVLVVPPGQRAVYHAAAVMASNCLIGVMDAAATLMEMAGVERALALKALGPLARASLNNVLVLGPEAALTGPIERGDARTVGAHLQALAAAPETVRHLYGAAGRHLVEVARRRNPGRDYAAIERVLEGE